MKKAQLLGLLSILFVYSMAWADNPTPAPTTSAVSASSTPSPAPKAKKKKKKKSSTATTQSTPSTPTTSQATPVTSPTPATPGKASAAVTPVSTSKEENSLLAGDSAYASKDYAKAVAAYSDYIKAKGKTPEAEKKLLQAKFYEGMALEQEARDGFKENDQYIKSDEESHNLMVYGKRQPSRGAHLVTLSVAFLTPQLLGGDIGFTFFSHWNVGLGIGFMGVDPRIKYYFDGDNASFFLGAGYATYAYNLSGNLNVGGGSGSFSGNLTGNFLHFTLGASFQDKNGMFMEIPFDVGVANFTGNGNANGSTTVSGGGGSGTVSGSNSGSGSYNGPMGMLGFRIGYSI